MQKRLKTEAIVTKELSTKKDPATTDKQIAPIPDWTSPTQILFHALKGSLRSFLIAFGMRGGISFAIRAFRMLSNKSTLKQAVQSFFNADSHRYARMVGSFSFIWKLVNNLLVFYRHPSRRIALSAEASLKPMKKASKLNGAIAGGLAGLAILFESKDNRVAFTQQLFMRAMQAGYRMLSTRNIFNFPDGDVYLFCIACASIMYAYALQPKTIPASYYKWMVRTAGVSDSVLSLNRSNLRAWEEYKKSSNAVQPTVNVNQVTQILDSLKAIPETRRRALEYMAKHKATMPTCPCALLHPTQTSCLLYNAWVWVRVFLNIMPVYGSLNGVPALVLNTTKVISDPITIAARIFKSSCQSSAFLASYVTVFQSCICALRNIYPDSFDSKYYYYLFGGITGLSILVERKSRRGELAMFALPKGIHSLYTVLANRGVVVRVPHLDLVGSCIAMSIIMSVYQCEPHQMSPMLYRVMSGVIGTY